MLHHKQLICVSPPTPGYSSASLLTVEWVYTVHWLVCRFTSAHRIHVWGSVCVLSCEESSAETAAWAERPSCCSVCLAKWAINPPPWAVTWAKSNIGLSIKAQVPLRVQSHTSARNAALALLSNNQGPNGDSQRHLSHAAVTSHSECSSDGRDDLLHF